MYFIFIDKSYWHSHLCYVDIVHICIRLPGGNGQLWTFPRECVLDLHSRQLQWMIHCISNFIRFFVTAITLACDGQNDATSNNTATSATILPHLVPGNYSDTEDGGKCHQSVSLLLIMQTIILVICIILEAMMVRTALKGTMWNFAPRQSMEYILYARLCKLTANEEMQISLTLLTTRI